MDGRRALEDHSDARPRRVERHAVAKEEQQNERKNEGDEDAARIAQDLPHLLANERRTRRARGPAEIRVARTRALMRRPSRGRTPR